MEVLSIAQIAHEANRVYCQSIGDLSQKHWEQSEMWQQASAIKGVKFCIENPDAPASANHESWLEEKKVSGWKYGPVKDEKKKEHPCIVPYDQLPKEQHYKDHLFKAIVAACVGVEV